MHCGSSADERLNVERIEDSSYGFRPQRSAHNALRKVAEHLCSGRTEVYDADLQAYFDTIPHEKLMRCLEMRPPRR